MLTVCLIPGDGVGQEVIPAAAQVMRVVMPNLRFVDGDAGWDCFLRTGTALPDATVEAIPRLMARSSARRNRPTRSCPAIAARS